VNSVPRRANLLRYGAFRESTIDPYSWFSMTMTTTGALDARVALESARRGAADADTGDVDNTSVVMTAAIAPRAAARLMGGRRTTGAAS
jgi:hypothetical protein